MLRLCHTSQNVVISLKSCTSIYLRRTNLMPQQSEFQSFQSCSHLTLVTAAQISWHLANMNVIFNGYSVILSFWTTCEDNGKEEIVMLRKRFLMIGVLIEGKRFFTLTTISTDWHHFMCPLICPSILPSGHTVLLFVMVWYQLILLIYIRLLHWHWGNLMIAPVPVK